MRTAHHMSCPIGGVGTSSRAHQVLVLEPLSPACHKRLRGECLRSRGQQRLCCASMGVQASATVRARVSSVPWCLYVQYLDVAFTALLRRRTLRRWLE